MQKTELIRNKLKEKVEGLLNEGKIDVFLGFGQGELKNQRVPLIVTKAEDAGKLTFDFFSSTLLSRYLLSPQLKDKKVGILVKGCDKRALNLLIKEKRVSPENIYTLGVNCNGVISFNRLRKNVENPEDSEIDIEGSILKVNPGTQEEVKFNYLNTISPHCLICTEQVLDEGEVDEKIDLPEPGELVFPLDEDKSNMETMLNKLEKKSGDSKYEFFRENLNKCRRCFACRSACPVCTCPKCVFEIENPGFMDKSTEESAQHQFYHVIRAFHVADRCVACGECERVCPENIPFYLLHEKIKKDMREMYGDEDDALSYAYLDDPEPFEEGGEA